MLRAQRAVFAFVGVLSVLVAGTTGCARRRDNAQVVSEVQDRMRADHQLMMGRFQVTGTNGVITLAGYVVSNHQRATAVRDAWQVKGVKVVVDNMLLVDSTRQSLSPKLLKLPAPLQNIFLRSKIPAIARPSVAKKVSPIDNSSRPSFTATRTSDSPRDAPSSGASVVHTVEVTSDIPSSAPLAASTSSATIPFPSTGQNLYALVTNNGPATAYAAVGNSSVIATPAGIPLLPGVPVPVPQGLSTNIAAITLTGTASITVTSGSGVPTVVYTVLSAPVGTSAVPLVPLAGTQTITVTSSAQGLTVPAGATKAVLSITTGNVHYRDDGTAPTPTVGLTLTPGPPFVYSGALGAIQFILPTGVGAATVTAAFYQ